MQIKFNEKIKKKSFLKTQFFLIEAIGSFLILAFSFALFFGVMALVAEIPFLLNLIKDKLPGTIIYLVITLPLLATPLFILIYQTYAYFRLYHFLKKNEPLLTKDAYLTQVYYFNSNGDLVFPESSPYPHDIGELEIGQALKFQGLDSSFEIESKDILRTEAIYYGRYKFNFKVKMTLISVSPNMFNISSIAISNISSPIYWNVKRNNENLFGLLKSI